MSNVSFYILFDTNFKYFWTDEVYVYNHCHPIQLFFYTENPFHKKSTFTFQNQLNNDVFSVRLPTRRNDKCFIQYQQNAKQPSFYL